MGDWGKYILFTVARHLNKGNLFLQRNIMTVREHINIIITSLFDK